MLKSKKKNKKKHKNHLKGEKLLSDKLYKKFIYIKIENKISIFHIFKR